MPSGPVFPAFIKLETQRDGSAKSTFLADVDDILGAAERKFQTFSGEAQRLVDAALSVQRNSSGSLDLGVPQLEAAAAAQQARAIAAREVAAATRLAAQEEGDYSRQARLAVAATEALAKEEEQAAAKALAHAAAAQQVQERLNRQASATDVVVQATRRGTDAHGAVTNSVRASRVAYTQLGQQMQDMVVQAQMGTSALTIFTQQVPQASFALSGLGGRVGEVARFLSGPWGAAIFAATAVLGPLIAQMIGFGEEADNAKGKAFDFSKGLDTMALSANQAVAAMDQLQQATRSAIAVQGNFLQTQAAIAGQSVKDLEARLADLQNKLKTEQGKGLGLNPFEYANPFKINWYSGQIAETQDALRAARAAEINASMAVSQTRAIESLDPRQKIEGDYQRAVGQLNNAFEQSRTDPIGATDKGIYYSEDAYQAEFKRLTKIKDAALDALRKSNSPHRSTSGLYGNEIDLAEARQIAEKNGLRITSAHRSYADQKRLYDQWVAAGKPPDNPVAVPGSSAHEKDNALDIAFGNGITPQSIRKAYADEGVRLTKILRERGHFHIEWSTSGADKAEAEAKRLAALGQAAAERVAQINERFDEQPRLIDQAAKATRELDAIIANLRDQQPPGFDKMIADAEMAKGVIADALQRPLREMARDSQRNLEIQTLTTAGYERQAQVLQAIWGYEERNGAATVEQRAEIERIVGAEYDHLEVLKQQQEVIGYYLDAAHSVRSTIEAIIAGQGKFSDFKQIFRQLQSKVITEALFGDVFRDLDKYVKEQTGIGSSVDLLKTETVRAGNAAGDFANALVAATAKVSSASAPSALPAAANDNMSILWSMRQLGVDSANRSATPGIGAFLGAGMPITVVGNKSGAGDKGVWALSPDAFFAKMFSSLAKPLLEPLNELLGPKFAAQISGVMGGAMSGYLTGGTPGGILGALKSIPDLPQDLAEKLGKMGRGAATGTMVAGLGNMLGLGMSSTGAQIGGAIGSMLPIPGGQIIGSIAGGLIGKLFSGTKGGYAIASNGGITSGGDSSQAASSGNAASAVQESLRKIADAFGGDVGNYAVSIGTRSSGWIHVDDRNTTAVSQGGSWIKNAGANALYNGKDMEEALKIAVKNAIEDGAILGISAAAKRLLSGGTDLDAQIKKAVDFEGVFTRLKRIKDPVGAALDDLNKEFTRLKAIFQEAGASAEEYGQLQELYGIERAKAVKQAMEEVGGSLKSLLDDLKIGDNGLSLRDRAANAYAKYTPLADRVKAGDTTAFNDFSQVARDYLEIQRQLYGSQTQYFDLYNEVKSISQTALDASQAIADASAASDSPFAGGATAGISDNASVVSAIDAQTNALLGGIDTLNGNLVAYMQMSSATNDNSAPPVNLFAYGGSGYF